VKLLKELSAPWDEQGRSFAVVLRLAILLHRSRALTQVPPIRLDMNKTQVRLTFPTGWLEEHPLTVADLEHEAGYLEPADINLIFR
jgi:exopolyphosphatase/guanosine-5'-triphosphate,3'-diphosphate pyrophosphatase